MGKGSDGKEEKFTAKVTEITLAEIPYTDLLTLKPINESTVIWYTNGKCKEEASNLGDKFNDTETYGHATTRDELFDLLEKTIRATIIVSDRDGFEMIKDLMTLNFNKTICEVIVKPDGTQGDL